MIITNSFLTVQIGTTCAITTASTKRRHKERKREKKSLTTRIKIYFYIAIVQLSHWIHFSRTMQISVHKNGIRGDYVKFHYIPFCP